MSTQNNLEEGFTSGTNHKPDYPKGKFDYDAWKSGKGPVRDKDDETEDEKKMVIRPKKHSFKSYVEEARRAKRA